MITINYGFKINAKESIDVRLILSKADMLACSGARPKYLLPDLYFGLCTDDGYFYKYDVTATEDPETGKFRKIDYLTKVDKDELQAAIDAEVARATGIESGLDERIKNLEARGRFLSSWDCTTGKPETEPERKPYAYKSGDYYIISIVGVSPTVNYQPEPIQYTGAASTVVESRAVAPGDYYTYDGSKWVWVKNTQQTVTFRQIAGSPDDNTALKAVLDTIRASVTSETTRAVGVENSLGQQIQTERSRAIGAEDTLQANITAEATARSNIDSQLAKAIQDEYDRATAAEEVLQGNIDAEATRAAGEETRIDTALQSEILRATAEEEKLAADILSEQTERIAEIARVEKKIDDETTRAIGKENEIAQDLAAEITRATGVEAQLRTDLNAEVTRASTKETEIETALASEKLAREAADAELENKKLNVPEGVKDPEDPWKGHPYNISYAFDIAADAEKAVVTTHTVTLDNTFTERKYSAAVPGATQATAGLMTAADKKKLDEVSDTYATKAELNAEVTRAKGEEAAIRTELATAIKEEADLREAGDIETLRKAAQLVEAEAARATEVESQLRADLTTETAERKAKDEEIAASLTQEIAERKAADIQLQSNIDKKVDKEVVGTNGKAKIFNEADGGGAKFEHNDGSESFIGVNDGGQDGLMAQIYADKLVDGKWQGAKIDVTNQGMYYTVGNKPYAERAIPENELATKKDVAGAGKVNDVKVDGVSVVDENKVANINDRASKQALADEEARAKAAELKLTQDLEAEVTRASEEETRIDTALQSEVARAQAEEAKKADLPGLCPPWLNPTGETPYPWFMASLDLESQGKGPDAEGNINVDVGAYNFNQKAYYKWEKQLPFAATQTRAGLETAADKIKVDHALQDTDTLILQCSYE